MHITIFFYAVKVQTKVCKLKYIQYLKNTYFGNVFLVANKQNILQKAKPE
jgi:hypothetical protein